MWEKYAGYALAFSIFFPILVFQAILKPVKLPFIGIGILLAILIIAQQKTTRLHKYSLVLIGIYLLRGVYGTISGVVQEAPGVYIVIPLCITYVVINFSFMVLVVKRKHFDWLIQILFFATAAVIVLDISFILNAFKIIPYLPILDLFQNSPTPFSIGINQYKSLEFYSRNLGILPFTLPFFMALLFDRSIKKRIKFLNTTTLVFLLLLMIALMLLSGRRIFILIMLITPVLLFLFSRKLRGDVKSRVNYGLLFFMTITIIASSVLFSYTAIEYGLSFENLTDSFLAAFDSNKETVRSEQSSALMESWRKAPIFGHGNGAIVDGYWRDQESPWRFEMGYHLSLHRLGLLGFSLEALYYLGIIVLGVRIIKRDNDIVMIGLLSGFLSFLLAHATNPFLNSYEFLWPIILPLFYINMKLLNTKNEYKQTDAL